jgi:hypothetical protein
MSVRGMVFTAVYRILTVQVMVIAVVMASMMLSMLFAFSLWVFVSLPTVNKILKIAILSHQTGNILVLLFCA